MPNRVRPTGSPVSGLFGAAEVLDADEADAGEERRRAEDGGRERAAELGQVLKMFSYVTPSANGTFTVA